MTEESPQSSFADPEPKKVPKATGRRLREQFEGFPIPTYIWQKRGDEFILVDYNETAHRASQGRVDSYIGETAREIYQDRPDILEQITVCFRERSTLQKEMSYAIPNTQEHYFLRVYYVYLPPDRVMVITEDNTERVRAQKEIERRANEFYALYQNSQILESQFDLSTLLEAIVDRAIALLSRREGGLFFYDAEHQILSVAIWRGPPLPPNTHLRLGESVAGQVALTRHPIIVSDYSRWAHHSSQLEWLKLRAVIGVPLLFSGELIGVLVVYERETTEHGFTESDKNLLSLFAGQAAAAIRNINIHEQMRQRIVELEAVNTISKAVRQAENLNDMLSILLDETLKVIATDAGIIWLYEAGKRELVSVVARGWCTSLAGRPMQINEEPIGKVFLSGETYFSREFLTDARTAGNLFPAGWGGVCLSIRTVHGVVGVFVASVQLPREIKAEEIRLLTTLSEIAGNAIHRMQLHQDTRQQAEELALAYDTTLEGWARALELRDKETEGHSRRVVTLAEDLARRLGLTEEEIIHLRRGVLLHDIGKMGIPDHILLKPGPLTEEEWAIMKQHPHYALDMLASIDYLKPALEIPYCHHERWDGKGYPRGIQGDEIPVGARIFAVIDVWDALCSDRPYRKSWPRNQAREYMQSQAGHAFDPKIVEAFLEIIETINP